MLDSGSREFVLFPSKHTRRYCDRGVVVESKDDTAVVEFIERIRPVIGSTVHVYRYRHETGTMSKSVHP